MAITHLPRIRLNSTAKAGEVLEVKTLISHEMENGLRKDAEGRLIPRNIIKQFVVKFNGKEVLRANWYPAISANPFVSFFVRVPETGKFEFNWIDDDGSVYKAEQTVTVS